MANNNVSLVSVAARISNLVRMSTTDINDVFSLGILLSKLEPAYLDRLERLEEEIGEKKANEWLVKILTDTAKFSSDDGETVEAIL